MARARPAAGGGPVPQVDGVVAVVSDTLVALVGPVGVRSLLLVGVLQGMLRSTVNRKAFEQPKQDQGKKQTGFTRK